MLRNGSCVSDFSKKELHGYVARVLCDSRDLTTGGTPFQLRIFMCFLSLVSGSWYLGSRPPTLLCFSIWWPCAMLLGLNIFSGINLCDYTIRISFLFCQSSWPFISTAWKLTWRKWTLCWGSHLTVWVFPYR
jgi:hypothetical protein